ncbi:hypothetical protein HYD70_00880 [Mycoplasmopsis bovis]|nr:hypothetical protein [Mycoplasmopsis bovis]QQH49697.1 hypothetical protein HYD70_00880 [Mycoplasmopsis bovis]
MQRISRWLVTQVDDLWRKLILNKEISIDLINYEDELDIDLREMALMQIFIQ